MIVISKKINYTEELKPVYIESMEASHVYMNALKKKSIGQTVEYKNKKEWVEFKELSSRKSVLPDSLFLRFMNSSIVRKKRGNVYDCPDFIVLRFKYGVNLRCEGMEEKINAHELRNMYYEKGVDYSVEKKNKEGKIIELKKIHYKMLMRSPGKAKSGDCVFIRDELHHKAINFLTMGFYDLMDEQSKNNPEKVFKLVELSAYQTLTTASAIGYISIPLENILIVKDSEVYSDGMKAAIVKNEKIKQIKKGEFEVDFESPKLESILNKKRFTVDVDKANQDVSLKLIDKTKQALKDNGIRINGKFPGTHPDVEEEMRKCSVTISENENIKNVLWDGMGLIDDEFFPENMEGFIYCRSHFFKSCLFRGNIQQFFKDYCDEHDDIDYETHTVEDVDIFNRKIRLCDIKVVISDKSLKWTKFIDMMGGTQQKAYRYYRKKMKKYDYYFSIVKTAHKSKFGDMQLSTYQMNDSLPTTDKKILRNVADNAIEIINDLKQSDEKYLQYLEMKSAIKKNDNFCIDRVILELVKWNKDFVKTEIFRKKKSNDISNMKSDFCEGRLPQVGDNLTIMDNPIALLLTAVGDKNPLDEGCFNLREDGVECYTPRFGDGECLAAFRSPHNSPNNIIHLHNVYPDKLLKYFPNIGKNVIVFNAIKTDTQCRLSGHDVDSDFVYTTNQLDLAELARKAYTENPTIINKVDELGISDYHFTLRDYARMDNSISDAQESIGTSTDIAQLALSYYYDSNMKNKELEECFIILSVIGQISIDLAKKTFDIDVVKEINRIRNLPCMDNKYIPKFFADTKKRRNNKKFDEDRIKSMNCPMDILAKQIEDDTISYSPRQYHMPLRDFLNKDVIGKGNRKKREKVIKQAEIYINNINWIESNKSDSNKSCYYLLRQREVSQFLYRAAKNLDQETIMLLVVYAFDDNNSDIRGAILNLLYESYREEFLNCFVKNEQKTEKIIA